MGGEYVQVVLGGGKLGGLQHCTIAIIVPVSNEESSESINLVIFSYFPMLHSRSGGPLLRLFRTKSGQGVADGIYSEVRILSCF